MDTSKAKLYNQIAQLYTRSNLDSAEFYVREAFAIEEKLNYRQGLQHSWYVSAIIETLRNDPEAAIKKYKLGLKIAEQLNDESWINAIANDLGATFGQQGRLIEAIEQFQKVLTLSQGIKDTIGISYALTNIGLVHSELGNKNKANEYLKLSGLMGIKSKNSYVRALSYSNLGAVHAYQKDTAKALQYEEKALEVASKNEDTYSLYTSYTNIGFYSLALNDPERAKESFDECFKVSQSIGDSSFIANAYLNYTELYLEQKAYRKAIKNAKNALQISQKINGQGSYIANIREKLALAYAGIGDYKNAYKYLDEHKILNDSLVSKDNRRQIANMETVYKTKAKVEENKILKMQNDKILKQQNIINAISIFLFLAIVSLFVIGYKMYNTRRKNIKSLEEKVEQRTTSLKTANASLERFNYVASHDLKEPLRSIVSSTQLLERNLKVDAKNLQFMTFIKRDTKRLYELVNAMILVAKYKQIELKPEEVDLNESVYNTVKGLQEILEDKNGTVEFDHLPTIKTDAAAIELILRQLIQNGITFNDNEAPLIQIKVFEKSESWQIHFIDNGIGIDEQFHDKVFEAFKRLHHYDKYSGTGIGLFLAKDLIEMQKGTIELSKNTKEGSTFIVTLVKSK